MFILCPLAGWMLGYCPQRSSRVSSECCVGLVTAGFLPLATPAAVPAGPIKWVIPAAANLPPYADGTAMVGDIVAYTWSRFHGVVLSTSRTLSNALSHGLVIFACNLVELAMAY